ncbi:MAG: deaminase [Chloroflexi bacterium]|nr:deaminase [Chloroflexota bacterium]
MNRPKVVVLSEVSVDGRLAVSRDRLLLYGDERWNAIATPGQVNVFELLRSIHKPEATLEGSGSFVRDVEEPQPWLGQETGHSSESLYSDFLPEAVLHRPGHRGWFTAVDGRGRIRWLYKEYLDEAWKGWWPLVWVSHSTPAEYVAYLRREEIPYLVAGQERVDLGAALEKMKSALGVTCVLSTAGGRLNGALVRAGLVDEVNIQFLPAIIGGFDTPSLFDAPNLKADELPTRLNLISAQVETGGRVWLRYEVVREAVSG